MMASACFLTKAAIISIILLNNWLEMAFSVRLFVNLVLPRDILLRNMGKWTNIGIFVHFAFSTEMGENIDFLRILREEVHASHFSHAPPTTFHEENLRKAVGSVFCDNITSFWRFVFSLVLQESPEVFELPGSTWTTAVTSDGRTRTTKKPIWAPAGRPIHSVEHLTPKELSWRRCKCPKISLIHSKLPFLQPEERIWWLAVYPCDSVALRFRSQEYILWVA